jgi:menaquinone-dependent protoporphyrinogen oxidase
MSDRQVLVAYANQAGSTAGIADKIASALVDDGLAVDCRPAADVTDLAPYAAIVLGSGVFVPSRRSDGNGFLARHEPDLGGRDVWLFAAGPIGRCPDPSEHGDAAVVAVGRAIGARGTAVFGPIGLPDDTDPATQLADPAGSARVRAWAHDIAAVVLARPIARSAVTA